MNRMSDINKTVGARIRYYRKARGITIVDLASRMHISKSAISKYECGQVAITLEQIVSIANTLELDPFLLLSDSFLPESHEIFKQDPPILDESFIKYYMYGFTGHEKAYLSKHMLLLGDKTCCLYGEIEDEENYRNCKYFYAGKLRTDAAFQRAFLTNPLNQDDIIILEKIIPLGKKDLQFAFGVSMSIGTNFPMAFKWLLSQRKIKNQAKIKELLALSTEDIKRMKAVNAFFVDFKDKRLG
ncbi:helix-turn-helix domain-containing protein [Ihubacter sp. rT4E-8]|uniref:helix-turn-helix domain-containing protein n=1 Tax=Ihubacter sp. rT4E-8 TaxID=3242369 RepID=UPI003CF0EE0C